MKADALASIVPTPQIIYETDNPQHWRFAKNQAIKKHGTTTSANLFSKVKPVVIPEVKIDSVPEPEDKLRAFNPELKEIEPKVNKPKNKGKVKK